MKLHSADFETYNAIELKMFECLEGDGSADDVIAFAQTLDVELTDEDITSLCWDYDEM